MPKSEIAALKKRVTDLLDPGILRIARKFYGVQLETYDYQLLWRFLPFVNWCIENQCMQLIELLDNNYKSGKHDDLVRLAPVDLVVRLLMEQRFDEGFTKPQAIYLKDLLLFGLEVRVVDGFANEIVALVIDLLIENQVEPNPGLLTLVEYVYSEDDMLDESTYLKQVLAQSIADHDFSNKETVEKLVEDLSTFIACYELGYRHEPVEIIDLKTLKEGATAWNVARKERFLSSEVTFAVPQQTYQSKTGRFTIHIIPRESEIPCWVRDCIDILCLEEERERLKMDELTSGERVFAFLKSHKNDPDVYVELIKKGSKYRVDECHFKRYNHKKLTEGMVRKELKPVQELFASDFRSFKAANQP
jgi:hypothetical protein